MGGRLTDEVDPRLRKGRHWLMTYAIFSDVHANPRALEAVLADARARRAERFICLGDVTGYGPDASGALERIRRNVDICLMGNHDAACVGIVSEDEVQENPNYWPDWKQRGEVGREGCQWLASRPLVWTSDPEDGPWTFACAHGDFVRPAEFDYVSCELDANRSFFTRTEPFLFVGHTHLAEVYERTEDGAVRSRSFRSFEPRPGRRYLVNVGSVGHPRQDVTTTYVLFDTVSGRLTARRLVFDAPRYALDLVERGLPVPLWLCVGSRNRRVG